MKVVLLQDVPKVGQKHDLKEVAAGYARNFLVPKGLAQAVSDENIKRIEALQQQREQEQAQRHDVRVKDLEKVTGQTVVFERGASETGSLFSGINAEDVGQALGEQLNTEAIEAQHVQIDAPIKELGQFSVTVAAENKQANLTVEVKASE